MGDLGISTLDRDLADEISGLRSAHLKKSGRHLRALTPLPSTPSAPTHIPMGPPQNPPGGGVGGTLRNLTTQRSQPHSHGTSTGSKGILPTQRSQAHSHRTSPEPPRGGRWEVP